LMGRAEKGEGRERVDGNGGERREREGGERERRREREGGEREERVERGEGWKERKGEREGGWIAEMNGNMRTKKHINTLKPKLCVCFSFYHKMINLLLNKSHSKLT